jgi:hypothetical protein
MMQIETQMNQLRLRGMARSWQARNLRKKL